MQTETNVPTLTRDFGSDNCGPDSVCGGLRAIESGNASAVTWALAPHPNDDNQPLIDQRVDYVTVGRAEIEGVLCWRICGEGHEPDGVGSHSLIASWESDHSLARACALLAGLLTRKARDRWIFRQPMSAPHG